jgi:BlaI family transcriptional regulator, penicillinase repressor
MAGPLAPRLGDLERQVMDHLWADRSGERWFTVREVHESLARDRDIAYTTVMTVLQRLAKKRLALEAREGRAYLYRATSSRGALTAAVMRDALDAAPAADRAVAIAHFVDQASRAEVDTLRAAVDARTP